ncbi:MAG: VWA domain-containing protein [Planctomycetales bacterium]|nr:VWA domain-containing protein [Planctomycetales bacterium]
MSVLVPLYLAGLGALSLPVLFHLIRRTPRGHQPFSTLLFLSPSPPRLTRRSRLDHWLLLLLRAAALALLALAFARPFFRASAVLSLEQLAGRRVAIVLDTSASMRRSDLWPQALAHAERTIKELGPNDDVALVTFDEHAQTIVDFERPGEPPTRDKPNLVRQQLKSLGPSWRSTDLGSALVSVATELDSAVEEAESIAEPQIVLITDLQSGSRVEDLQAYEWPSQVPVVVHAVRASKSSNASALLLTDTEHATEDDDSRVRVINAADSTAEQFFVRWQSADGRLAADESLPVHVPAGQSRVVRLKRPSELTADRIELIGDDDVFDNLHFVVPPRIETLPVVYIGNDSPTDPEGPRYYMEIAWADDALRQVELHTLTDEEAADSDEGGDEERASSESGAASDSSGGKPNLTWSELSTLRPKAVVVTGALSATMQERLRNFAESGGLLLLSPLSREAAATHAALFDGVEVIAPDLEAAEGDSTAEATESRDCDVEQAAGGRRGYRLLAEIDFSHPLFQPFSNPRYNDFTAIHFWRHRRLRLEDDSPVQTLARFDNGDPAILEQALGDGRAILFTSGWHPADSQLALSSKFVPLMQLLLDQAAGGKLVRSSVEVGESLALPAWKSRANVVNARRLRTVTKPDRTIVRLTSDATNFDDTDQPGLYELRSDEETYLFAVNLDASESNTAPLDVGQLEQAGVRLGTEITQAERRDRLRQQRDKELEDRQQVWRWLIVAALGILMLETGLASRAARQTNQPTEATS